MQIVQLVFKQAGNLYVHLPNVDSINLHLVYNWSTYSLKYSVIIWNVFVDSQKHSIPLSCRFALQKTEGKAFFCAVAMTFWGSGEPRWDAAQLSMPSGDQVCKDSSGFSVRWFLGTGDAAVLSKQVLPFVFSDVIHMQTQKPQISWFFFLNSMMNFLVLCGIHWQFYKPYIKYTHPFTIGIFVSPSIAGHRCRVYKL